MNARSKIVLAAAIVAVIAGTSGAAVADTTSQLTSQLRTRVHVHTQHASQRADQPMSQIMNQTIGPLDSVQPGSSSVREPGYLTVTAIASSCVTRVQAWAVSAVTGDLVSSAVATGKGTLFTLRVPFPRDAATGTWYLYSVDATVCGTKAVGWNTEWDGYDTVTVLS